MAKATKILVEYDNVSRCVRARVGRVSVTGYWTFESFGDAVTEVIAMGWVPVNAAGQDLSFWKDT